MTDVGVNAAPEANTQAQRTALSDQRMFEVAIELVNERGTAKTTLKDIGEGAGYSRGLASYRFGSKDVFFWILEPFLVDFGTVVG